MPGPKATIYGFSGTVVSNETGIDRVSWLTEGGLSNSENPAQK